MAYQTLEHNTDEHLYEYLKSLDPDDVEDITGKTIYYRGLDYSEDGLVSKMRFESNSKLIATVSGSSNYKIEILKENDEIFASCNCPYAHSGACKHIAAVLIDISERKLPEMPEFETKSQKRDGSFREYLSHITKEKLIDLVDEFAPESYKNKIEMKSASKDEVLDQFEVLRNDFEYVLEDEELLHAPYEFSNELDRLLEELSSFWESAPQETGDLLIYLMNSIRELNDEGYLYVDYPEEWFETDSFDSYIAEFANQLEGDIRIKFILDIEAIYNSTSYFGAYQKISSNLTANDLSALKNRIIESVENGKHVDFKYTYEKVKHLLTIEEKANILEKLKSYTDYFIEYLSFLKQQKQYKKGKELIENYLKEEKHYHIEQKIFEYWFDFLYLLNIVIFEPAKKALQMSSNKEMLKVILKYLPDEAKTFEQILEEKAPTQLLEYYEDTDRLKDGVNLINRSNIYESYVYEFFSRHKKEFPKSAEKHFIKRIMSNLEHTGDSYYINIASTLKDLQTINPTKSRQLAIMIRTEYKRRKNLIGRISQF